MGRRSIQLAGRFCPYCDEPMRPASPLEGVEVDVCSGCAAVWFDETELREYRRLSGVDFERGSITRRKASWSDELLHCPRCDRESLRRGRRGWIKIAACVECRGYLFPSLKPASGSRLMRETIPFKLLPSRLDVALFGAGFAILVGFLWLLRLAF